MFQFRTNKITTRGKKKKKKREKNVQKSACSRSSLLDNDKKGVMIFVSMSHAIWKATDATGNISVIDERERA